MAVFSKAFATTMVLVAALQARADVFMGDSISITGQTGLGVPDVHWGTSANPVAGSENGQPHTVGGASLYADDVSGLGFPVTVTSGASPNGLSGFVTIDLTEFYPGDFIFHSIFIGLKEDGSLMTAEVTQGPGAVSIIGDGNALNYFAIGGELGLSPVVTITWTQIPAPSAGLALLMGFAGRKRRRL